MKVVFTPLAARQIDDLYDYIATHSNEATADVYVGRIVDHCQQLALFPKRGAMRDDILEGLRTIGFERRVTIAFMITREAVLIEGIFYGGQNFEAAFQR